MSSHSEDQASTVHAVEINEKVVTQLQVQSCTSLQTLNEADNGRTYSASTYASPLDDEHPHIRKYRFFPPLPSKDPGPPPDGGLTAWLQVVAGCLACVVTWGLITSFGVFQLYYEEATDASPSSISWIGTMQTFLLLLLGTVSGRASDAGLLHEVTCAGSILIVLGMITASLSEKYHFLLLSQGICVGLGMGLLYVPSLAVPSSYFRQRKPLAVGMMASGIGIGGLIYPAIAQALLPRVGFGWTMRTMAFVTAFVCLIINCLLRVRTPPRRSGPLADFGAFKDPAYVLLAAGWFLTYWAIYFTFYYIDVYGHKFAEFDSLDSINILLITNGLGVPGRILPGVVASFWLGPINTVIPAAVATATIVYCWIAVANTHLSLYVFAAIYGLMAAALQGSFSITMAALTDDASELGTRMGMVFTIVAFAALTGSPIAGAIIQAEDGKYLGAQLWAGASITLGAVAFIAARISRTGWVLRAKI